MLSRQSVLSCSAINEILMSATLPTKNIFIVFIKKQPHEAVVFFKMLHC